MKLVGGGSVLTGPTPSSLQANGFYLLKMILTEISLWLKIILTERVNNRIKKTSNMFLLTKPLSASAETPSLWLKMILTEISLWLKMILTERVKSRIRTSIEIIH